MVNISRFSFNVRLLSLSAVSLDRIRPHKTRRTCDSSRTYWTSTHNLVFPRWRWAFGVIHQPMTSAYSILKIVGGILSMRPRWATVKNTPTTHRGMTVPPEDDHCIDEDCMSVCVYASSWVRFSVFLFYRTFFLFLRHACVFFATFEEHHFYAVF